MTKTVLTEQIATKRSRSRLIWLGVAIFLILLTSSVSIYQYLKPLPQGVSYEGDVHSADQIEFLYDLTFENKGQINHDQVIFDQIHTMIEEAEDFILIDMFLFNDEYDRSATYPSVSTDLMQALLDKKKQNEQISITVITDRINTFYGSYRSEIAAKLEEQGIQVVFTDMKPMRDSNPVYSGAYRTFLQWFGTEGSGWIPNAFSPDSQDVTLRSYLDLLNFKANHRKVVVTEKEGMVTSANPHDGSSLHSNIAFVVKGEILQELVQTEKTVAQLSGADVNLAENMAVSDMTETGEYTVQVLTEGKIKKHLLSEITNSKENEKITIGAFYLSDRDIVKQLIAASKRGVEVKLILDANKDAFGREKNGVPNRPAAHELVTRSNDEIQVRWYKTNGEQYHTKLAFFEREKEDIVIGGSANFTKRNLGDFNLETDLKVTGPANTGIMSEVEEYFDTIWNNKSGRYTEDYEMFEDDSVMLRFLYRFQEWSGISSF
ncbi:phospholipase D family protein [Bacillus sp. UMB0893]|uniref:phospholipase D family protein n=1 Tax=Bacillus sp. UMB0893 TaxID=2066053 RepID=UPI000C7569A2|nr:phospholipase D family protein [Bacillus sp. UMB0893]PLR69071.1 phospholipase [Bacillus sp. UMB0893]